MKIIHVIFLNNKFNNYKERSVNVVVLEYTSCDVSNGHKRHLWTESGLFVQTLQFLDEGLFFAVSCFSAIFISGTCSESCTHCPEEGFFHMSWSWKRLENDN